MKTADEGMKAETKKGLDYLKGRTEYHLKKMRRDYEAFLNGLKHGEEPVTIDAVPSDRGLAAPGHDPVTGEVHEKPERAQWHDEKQSGRGSGDAQAVSLADVAGHGLRALAAAEATVSGVEVKLSAYGAVVAEVE